MCLVNSMKYGTSKGTCLVMEIWNYYVNHGDKEYRGGKSVEKKVTCHIEDQKQLQNVKQGEEKGSPGSGTETAACRQHWLGGGALGCFSKLIRKSRLSHKRVPFAGESLGYHCPEGFMESLKASRTAWLD